MAPKAPQVWGSGHDLVPVVTNEQEGVRSWCDSTEETALEDSPVENVSEDLGGNTDGDIQQGVAGPFELDNIAGRVPYLVVQLTYRLFICLGTHTKELSEHAM